LGADGGQLMVMALNGARFLKDERQMTTTATTAIKWATDL
jgi:hypothetical protein